MARWDSRVCPALPKLLRNEHHDYRTRLDMYSSLALVFVVLSGAASRRAASSSKRFALRCSSAPAFWKTLHALLERTDQQRTPLQREVGRIGRALGVANVVGGVIRVEPSGPCGSSPDRDA